MKRPIIAGGTPCQKLANLVDIQQPTQALEHDKESIKYQLS